jgi:hypothetical protein
MTRPTPHHRTGPRGGSQRGAAAVEFVILLPILVVILFAITSFGLAFSRFVNYISAAREGARYAAVHCSPEATQCTQDLIEERVTDAAVGYPIGPGAPDADRDCTLDPGLPVMVSWEQEIPIHVPLLPDLSRTVTIEGSFRCE